MTCNVCNKPLRRHNTIGTCRAHRGQSQIRRDYERSWQRDNSLQYADAKKRWARKHPEYFTNWRNADINRIIAHKLRTRIRRAVKMGSAIANLGCSVPELKARLEAMFWDGMTWENYGKWEIDHIIPLSTFDLVNPIELAKACNYQNLQPLWKADNIRKFAKLDYNPKSA